jgi:hypothetical protein
MALPFSFKGLTNQLIDFFVARFHRCEDITHLIRRGKDIQNPKIFKKLLRLDHRPYYPTQMGESIDKEKLARLIDDMIWGNFEWEAERAFIAGWCTPSGKLIISDGHHRYLAAVATGRLDTLRQNFRRIHSETVHYRWKQLKYKKVKG